VTASILSARPLGAQLGVVLGVVGFWAFAGVGADRQPGYDPATDYLSSLAGRGAVEPGWGLAMLASAIVAVLAAALRVRSPLLVVAAVSLTVAGVFRVDCPAGAAGCNAGPLVVEPGVTGQVHSAAVVGYQVFFSAAMLHLAWRCRQVGRCRAAVAALAGALVPLVLAGDPLPLDPGVSQRLWVASGQAVLLMLAFWPAGRATVAE